MSSGNARLGFICPMPGHTLNTMPGKHADVLYNYLFLLIFFVFLIALPTLVQAQETGEELTVNSATLGNQGEELGAGSEQEQLANIFKLQKQLVYDLLRQAGINPDNLPPEVKKAIDKPHTKNLKAFLAFAEGLEQMDQGNYKAAEAKFKEAVALDPAFGLAQELLDTVPRNALEPNQIADLMRTGAAGAPAKTPQDPTGTANDANTFYNNDLNNRTSSGETDKKVSDQQPQVETTTVTPDTPPVVTPPPPPVTPPPGVVIPPPPPPVFASYAAFVESDFDGFLPRQPYIGSSDVPRGGSIDIPQVFLDVESTPGLLRANVDANGHLSSLIGFVSDANSTGIVETINIPLTRTVNQTFPSLEAGFYTATGTWVSDRDVFGPGSFIINRLLFKPNANDPNTGALAFAEGTPTPVAALAELASTQGSAFYRGTAGAFITSDFVALPPCPNCGSFSMTLDFAANQARDVNIVIPANVAIPDFQIQSTEPAAITNGRFAFNNTNATFSFPSSGVTATAQGLLQGGAYGPRAESVGGTFVAQDPLNGNRAQGFFGGIQAAPPGPIVD